MYKQLIILIQIIALSASVPSSRIAGGSVAYLGQFPWHAKLEPFINGSRHLCGGALIKYNWILTAGQCIVDAADIIVKLGIVERLGEPEFSIWVRERADIYVYDYYSSDPENNIYRHDIGMVYLETINENILLSPYIATIALPRPDQIPENITEFIGEIGTITGFGIDIDGLQTERLKYLLMEVISIDGCRDDHGTNSAIVTDTHFCSSAPPRYSTCKGDEGAPFVIEINGESVLAGIGSTALDNCSFGLPAIFTNILPYLDWIGDIVDPPIEETTTTTTARPPNGDGDTRCVCICKFCGCDQDSSTVKSEF